MTQLGKSAVIYYPVYFSAEFDEALFACENKENYANSNIQPPKIPLLKPPDYVSNSHVSIDPSFSQTCDSSLHHSASNKNEKVKVEKLE